MKTEMYQRKPLTVEAVLVTEDNLYDVAKWCGGDVRTHNTTGKKFIQIEVIHPLNPKQTKAMLGEWVLKSNQGYKIYSDAAFRKGWERIGNVGRALTEAFQSKGSGEGTVLVTTAPGSPAAMLMLHETMTQAERDIIDGVKEA